MNAQQDQTTDVLFQREPRLIHALTHADARGFLTKAPGIGMAGSVIRDVFWSLSHENVARGFHFHAHSSVHTKYVQVITGSIDDFVIDLRGNGGSYGSLGHHHMTRESGVLEVPEGFGHAFIAREQDTRVLYSTTYDYDPRFDQGLSMLGFGIPIPSEVIFSERDMSFPRFSDFRSPFLG